jgi:hypothetical protein
MGGWARASGVGVAALLAGCGHEPDRAVTSAESTTSSQSATTSFTAGPTESTSSSSSSSTSTTEVTEDDGDGFISGHDWRSEPQCDPWAQDCPLGEKCMPWANDGGDAWNAMKCVPIARDPAQPGEPCTVEGSPTSGLDDCDIASMCFYVDPRTNMGTCVAFCGGDPTGTTCPPGTDCPITDSSVLILCLPLCHPLASDCAVGLCAPMVADFHCVPNESGDAGAYGEPCAYVNACDPGLFCADAATVPGCAGASGCCSEFCDVTLTDPDSQCAGQAEGQECLPWYAEGDAPPGYENVGVCGIPL